MGAITDLAGFDEPVYSIDTTDQLLGGAAGPLNKAAQNLANRTAYLLALAGNFGEVLPFNTNHALTASEVLRNLIVIDANGTTLTITLPDSSTLFTGAKVIVTAINVNQSQVTLNCFGADEFGPSPSFSQMFLGDGELVELTLYGTTWIITQKPENYTDVGGIVYRYKQLPNTVIAQGQLLNRADYPRLWAYVQTLGSIVVSDITWSNPGYKGFFSSGNNATTFRVPDLRAMFIRGLDLSAGIDLERNVALPGGYEGDTVGSHVHGMPTDDATLTTGGAGKYVGLTQLSGAKAYTDGNIGTTETRPKNIGLLPLIKV